MTNEHDSSAPSNAALPADDALPQASSAGDRLAIYAGSFDPPTLGHEWMIRRGAELFDRLIVAIGENAEKSYSYSMDRRIEWLHAMCSEYQHVEASSFENRYLVDFAREHNAGFILRGIRNEADYTFERGMRNINEDLHPSCTTVFLIPPRAYGEISSSLVKGLIGSSGWHEVVRRYVPAAVFEDLKRHHV